MTADRRQEHDRKNPPSERGQGERATPSRSAGMSTIEVVGMVAIAGLAIVPMLQVQGEITRAYTRHLETYQQLTRQRNALALLETLNPASNPSGSSRLANDYELVWRSEPLTPAIRSAGYPSGNGGFRVVLYLVQVSILRPDGSVADAFETEKIGWLKDAPEESEESRFG